MMDIQQLREHLAAHHPGIGLANMTYPDGRPEHDLAYAHLTQHVLWPRTDGHDHDPAELGDAGMHAAARELARSLGLPRVSCAQCGHSGPPQLFEPFNAAGNLACRAVTLCQLRQQGTDPAALLGTLLREFERHDEGHPGELDTLTTRELAELDLDMRGPRGEFLGGCSGAVRVYLGGRGDSAQAIADTEADRLARRRRRAALKAAETRRANRAGA